MLKGKQKTADSANKGADEQETSFRNNPEKNAKIDAYIAANPREWERLMDTPHERLARTVVLGKVEKREGIDNAIWKSIENNPERKKALEGLVADLPKEKQREGMLNLEKQMRRDSKIAETQMQKKPSKGISA